MLEAIASQFTRDVTGWRDKSTASLSTLSLGNRVWKPRRTGALSVPLVSPIHGGAHVERDERPREPTRLPPTSPPLDPSSSRRQKEPTFASVFSLLPLFPSSVVHLSRTIPSRLSPFFLTVLVFNSPRRTSSSSSSTGSPRIYQRGTVPPFSSSLSSLIIALSTQMSWIGLRRQNHRTPWTTIRIFGAFL